MVVKYWCCLKKGKTILILALADCIFFQRYAGTLHVYYWNTPKLLGEIIYFLKIEFYDFSPLKSTVLELILQIPNPSTIIFVRISHWVIVGSKKFELSWKRHYEDFEISLFH